MFENAAGFEGHLGEYVVVAIFRDDQIAVAVIKIVHKCRKALEVPLHHA